MAAAMPQKCVLLCDQGALDLKAFLKKEEWKRLTHSTDDGGCDHCSSSFSDSFLYLNIFIYISRTQYFNDIMLHVQTKENLNTLSLCLSLSSVSFFCFFLLFLSPVFFLLFLLSLDPMNILGSFTAHQFFLLLICCCSRSPSEAELLERYDHVLQLRPDATSNDLAAECALKSISSQSQVLLKSSLHICLLHSC